MTDSEQASKSTISDVNPTQCVQLCGQIISSPLAKSQKFLLPIVTHVTSEK